MNRKLWWPRNRNCGFGSLWYTVHLKVNRLQPGFTGCWSFQKVPKVPAEYILLNVAVSPWHCRWSPRFYLRLFELLLWQRADARKVRLRNSRRWPFHYQPSCRKPNWLIVCRREKGNINQIKWIFHGFYWDSPVLRRNGYCECKS